MSTGKAKTKLKDVISSSPLKEFSTIDLQDDNDVNFPTAFNVVTDEDQCMYEEINIELLDVNVFESVHDFIIDKCSPKLCGYEMKWS